MPEHRSPDDVLATLPDDPSGGAHRVTDADDGPPDLPPDDVPEPAGADTPSAGRAGSDLTPLTERLERIEAALAATTRALEDGAERAAARERVIDRQHAEIERLKSIERVGAMRPVVVELGRLRNDLLRQARTLRPDTSVDRFASLLDSFADSVADALEGCGTEPLPVGIGAAFVPQQHRVATVVPTADPALDGTVAEIVADGYVETDGGKVVTPARVALHRFDEPADGPAPEPATGDGPGHAAAHPAASEPTGIGTPHDTPSTSHQRGDHND